MPPKGRKCTHCQSIKAESAFGKQSVGATTASKSKSPPSTSPATNSKPGNSSNVEVAICKHCRHSNDQEDGEIVSNEDEEESRFMRCLDCSKVHPKSHFINNFANEGNAALFGESCSTCRGVEEDQQTSTAKSDDPETVPSTVERTCKRCDRELPETCFWVGINAKPWNSPLPCRLCISCRLLDEAQSIFAEPDFAGALILSKVCSACESNFPTMDYIKGSVEIDDEGDVVLFPACVKCRFKAHKSEHEKAKHPRDSAKLLFSENKPKRKILPLRPKRVVSEPVGKSSNLDAILGNPLIQGGPSAATTFASVAPTHSPARPPKRAHRQTHLTQSNETCVMCGKDGWEELDAEDNSEIPVCPDCRELDRTCGLGLRPRRAGSRRKTYTE